MSEEKKFHFASETAIGYIEGDLHLFIDGSELDGTFDMGDAKMRLREGHYENDHFSGNFSETVLFTPVEGTIEGQIEGEDCTLTMTTGFGTRVMKSV
ncbi:MAG: hypothetical protein IJH61_07500 [Eubacteriaceae bacterium]|nr:hypothetical protein [Eubacteriaceae bacterium]